MIAALKAKVLALVAKLQAPIAAHPVKAVAIALVVGLIVGVVAC